MINGHRVIAVEEHFVTSDYIRSSHGLLPIESDQNEVMLTRALENSESFGPMLLDLDARLRTMDEIGQDAAVLSLNPPGVQPYRSADAVPLARQFNDELATIVRQRPTRFGGLATVAPQDPDSAAEEIARIMGPLGLNGIMINSHTADEYLDHSKFDPLLSAAEDHHAPIYLHPRVPAARGAYMDYGMSAAIWGYQAEAGLHAMRLILSGTLDRHPDLTIVLGHLGEGLPYWLRRIDNRYAFAHHHAGAASSAMPRLELTPSEYFRRNFLVTTSGIDDPNVFELAMRTVGHANIMFAIDMPYEDSALAAEFLAGLDLTDDQRAAISHRNAERAFALRGEGREQQA